MKTQQLNSFKSKFHLLNSPASSEEIVWSCSDSSDYENHSCNKNNLKSRKRKRKQVKSKKNVSLNTSHLDITIIDGTENSSSKVTQKLSNCANDCKSPILKSTRRCVTKSNKTSFIDLSSNENKQVSPILVQKNSSQKILPNVRKRLFENNNIHIEKNRERSVSPILTCTENALKKSKTRDNHLISNGISIRDKINIYRINNQDPNNITRVFPRDEDENNIHWTQEIPCSSSHSRQKHQVPPTTQDEDTSIDTIKNVALIDKVKSYFDSHFSSTSQSQHSISDYESKNSSKSNNDIESINSLSEEKIPQINLENQSDSLKSYNDTYVHKTKKVKYKKDGLAFRLNALLKKHNASTSLWYHERYLAANSNFIVPKEDFITFRIKSTTIKYGSYLLNVLDVTNELCLVFINSTYVRSNCMDRDMIFKLYKPYRMLRFEKYKLFINVCKYECVVLKNKRR